MKSYNLIHLAASGHSRRLVVKRLVDLSVAASALLVLSPVFLLVYLSVLTTMGRPVVYRQMRPGRGGDTFSICKFRTMTDARDEDGNLLPDGKRLTALGRLLRASSVDELPELWNVLRGDMSLVGPRPLLLAYNDYLTQAELCRGLVRPGITGWAQVHGRNDASWDERLERDLWYLTHWSLRLDVKILAMTIKRVVTARGVVVNPESAMLNLDEERRVRRIQGG